MDSTDARIPESDLRAFRVWLKFSRADEMFEANLRAGRQGFDPIMRWNKYVKPRVKAEFRAEAARF
jgi:hypothetical protein